MTRMPTSPAGKSATGVTLLELLVVLVIVGLIVGAMPRLMGGGEAAKTRAAAREVANTLRQARSRAILENRDVVVRIDTAERRFASGAEAPWRALPEALTLQVETAASEQIDDDIAGLRFFADGSSSGGRITLAGEARSYHVMLHWLTGTVEIRE